jgi:hypothetical protein
MLVGRKKGEGPSSFVVRGFRVASLIRQHSLIAMHHRRKTVDHGNNHGCRRKRELNTWLPGHDETVEPLLVR